MDYEKINDHTGNILIGYMAFFAGMDLQNILDWVDWATGIEKGEKDDSTDQDAIRKGYEMAENKAGN